MESNDAMAIAPFVLKTYQMVNDPSSDNLIRWGKSDNSFVVVNSLSFSQSLLPAFFKHNNFSSFIRQLNTYGFRKVDPEICEFANEWFLRGRIHLLKNIGRKRQSSNGNPNSRGVSFLRFEEDDKIMAMEIARLKTEQKAMEMELVEMNRRLAATERRPRQITALLCLVARDPEILPRMMMETVQKRLLEKKRQRMVETTSSASSSLTVNEEVWRWSTVADTAFPTSNGGPPPTPPPYPFSLLGGGF